MSFNAQNIEITPGILSLIAELDEFKGAWRALGTLAPERLSALRRVATIESIGSSTRIEGSKLSDLDVERLLQNIEIRQFSSRDEQEVAGYADVMETVFASYDAIDSTENHIKQLHRDLLKYSAKDDRHRGDYKTNINHVSAFDEDGGEIGVIFETATPLDTPRLMKELVGWLNDLSVQILELAKEHGRLTTSGIVDLTGANRNTVKKHLQALVSANHLAQHGVGKGTWYGRP